jgi:hypothetical protein
MLLNFYQLLMWFWPVNRLLWLTLNLALIIQCCHEIMFFFLNFIYPIKCLYVPQAEIHWSSKHRTHFSETPLLLLK